jgi:hypothetical protein
LSVRLIYSVRSRSKGERPPWGVINFVPPRILHIYQQPGAIMKFGMYHSLKLPSGRCAKGFPPEHDRLRLNSHSLIFLRGDGKDQPSGAAKSIDLFNTTLSSSQVRSFPIVHHST